MEHTEIMTAAAAVAGSADAPLHLTPAAVDKAKQALAREGLEGWGLRVGVVGGGCSGFQYTINFEQAAKPDDVTFDIEGLHVFVDGMSVQYLNGTTVDYVSGLHGAGFKFVNPNATRTCGCGSSFSA